MNQNSVSTAELLRDYLQAHQQDFYRLAYSYTKNRDAALDVVQDSIVKAISKSGALKHPEHLKTWFYRILVNESLSYLRKNRHLLSDDSALENVPEPDGDPTDAMDLYRSIGRLEPKVKTVILLRFFEDLKLDEIAAVTNSNLSTTKSRLYQGLKLLKAYLE